MMSQRDAEPGAQAMSDANRGVFLNSPTPRIITRFPKVLLVNAAAARLLGYPDPDALGGRDFIDLVAPRFRDAILARGRRLIEASVGEALPLFEIAMFRADGAEVSVEISGSCVMLADGLAQLTTLNDLSEIRHTQAALARSERMLEQIYRTTSDAVLLLDTATGLIQFVNPAFTRMFAYSAEEAVGRPAIALGLWMDAGEREAWSEKLGRSGTVVSPLVRLRTRDGQLVRAQVSGSVFVIDGVRHALVVYRDVAESEDQRLINESMLAHAQIGISVLRDRRIQRGNPALAAMFGYAQAEIDGMLVEQLVDAAPESRLAFAVALKTASETGSVDTVLRLRRRGGEAFSCRVRYDRFDRSDPGPGGVLILEDISATHAQRRMNEAILEGASVGIALTRDGVVVRANRVLAEMLGAPPETLLGCSVGEFLADPASVATLRARATQTAIEGHTFDLPLQARRKDGSLFWVRLRSRPLDPSDLGEGWVLIIEDISEEREAQQALARAKEAAEAASRAKSAFLANTSHEIRTPLNAVLGLARLIQRTPEPAQREELLARLIGSAESLVGIVSDILDFSKIEAGGLSLEQVEMDLFGLFQLLRQGYADLAEARGLSLGMQLDPSLPQRIRADPVRLRQILGNFLSNAIKFTERGGIEVRATVPQPGWMRVEVRDTGIGIPAETLSGLFTPFTQADSSTTRRFGGTGLGLAIARDLAHRMRGEVGAQSRVGEGSCFWLAVPLEAIATVAPAEAGAEAEPMPRRGARVLLVEDNEINRLIASAMLEDWGIAVVEAGDGEHALATIFGDAQGFDAVLMDIHMPVMSGLEASQAIRKRLGDGLPIIALTAAALENEREQAFAAGMNDFVSKPIDPARLRQALVRWLA